MAKKRRAGISILIPALLTLAGIFTIISAFHPTDTGMAGRYYHEYFLQPYWGRSAWYFGVYLILAGLFSGLARSPFAKLLALTLLLIPLLMATDDSYSFAHVHSERNIGGLLKITSFKYLGKLGTLLLEIVLLLAGCLLLFPVPRMLKAVPRLTLKKRKAPPKRDTPNEHTPNEGRATDATERKPTKMRKLFDLNRRVNRYERPVPPAPPKGEAKISGGHCKQQTRIVKAFASFGTEIEIGKSTYGPFSERYELIPRQGVKRREIERLVQDRDISAALGIKNVKVSEDFDAKLYLELPHKRKPPISFSALTKSFLKSREREKQAIPILIGVDAEFNPISCDLAQLPHLLIAGTTGSGKSVLVKSIITSILCASTPNEVKIILVDPKLVEFGIFSSSPFLACDVITDVETTSLMIEDLIDEMERRYALLKKSGRYTLKTYNENISERERLPSVVAIIDEFADLMMMKKSNISENIVRIAQKGRAAGIHFILATQRPSVNVINGLIKANIPGRIALKVASDIDSRTILDKTGAERLTGNGHMIFSFNETTELQGAYIKDEEIESIVKGSRAD